jgi:hypothetical protein
MQSSHPKFEFEFKCRWWTRAEKPWQALAACMEVRDALASGNPAAFLSRLPVQVPHSYPQYYTVHSTCTPAFLSD